MGGTTARDISLPSRGASDYAYNRANAQNQRIHFTFVPARSGDKFNHGPLSVESQQTIELFLRPSPSSTPPPHKLIYLWTHMAGPVMASFPIKAHAQ